jgi:hypothetical protein
MRMLVAAVAITTIATALHAEEKPPLPLPVSGVHDSTALIIERSEPPVPPKCRALLGEPAVIWQAYQACIETEAAKARSVQDLHPR